MPAANPTPHTPESLNVYCQMIESQLSRLKYCVDVMRASSLQTVVTMHDDSFHTGLKKLQTFVSATEKATTQRLANPQLDVEESREVMNQAAKSGQRLPQKKKSAKRKAKD